MSAKSGRRSGGMDGSVEEKEWTTVDTEMDNKDSKEMTLEDEDNNQSLNDFKNFKNFLKSSHLFLIQLFLF